MLDSLFHVGLSNACLACLLAILATIVSARFKQPQVAHILWLLVMVKLITPPLIAVPISFPGMQAQVSYTPSAEPTATMPAAATRSSIVAAVGETTFVADPPAPKAAAGELMMVWLARLWLFGTCGIVGWSLIRVRRFDRLLKQNLQAAPPHVQQVARRLSRQLGLKHSPSLSVTTAQISPMVWWIGGTVRVVLPQSLLKQLQPEQWQWVIAHELAHVRRRDYLVRWLEWAACVCCWWNPIAWWAQRNLRATEEACCDELVLRSFNPGSHAYAQSIMNAIETLVCPAARPPAMASEINSGGFLERRIEMILSNSSAAKPTSLLHFGFAALALLCIPLSLVQAQDIEAVKRRLTSAVKHDEITFEHAAVMMDALHEALERDHEEGHEEGHEEESERERQHKFRQIASELEQAVEAGKLTHEQAAERLADLKKHLWKDNQGREGEEREHRFHEAEMEMKHLIEAGKITHEQANERLADLKKTLWKADRDRDDEDEDEGKEREHRFHEAEMEMKHLIKRLEELKQRMGNKGHDGAGKERAHRYHAAEINIKRLIEAGEITPDEAAERLAELKQRMQQDSDDHRAEGEAEEN